MLVLILFGPLLLLPTPLRWLAMDWAMTMLLVMILLGWGVVMSVLIGIAFAHPPKLLGWLEQRLRLWVAGFSEDPARVWIHWARQAHRPDLGRWCLEQAAEQGNAEGLFQEGLVFLEGGFGPSGQDAAMHRFHRAAIKGHLEAAFRFAVCLRTGAGRSLREAEQAETWYLRSAAQGFGPAAQWLGQAYAHGDGVVQDEAKARHWAEIAAGLQPCPDLSRSVLRHDAGREDPLVAWFGQVSRGLDGAGGWLVARRSGRWALLALAGLFLLVALAAVVGFFWAGSSALHHLPLLMLMPPLLMMVWQAFRLRQDRPRRGRDRLREAAETGDPEACYELGVAHRSGHSSRTKDDLSAALWFRRAAEAGHPLAMRALADAYLGGHGVPRDPREAARWADAARRESTFQARAPMNPSR